MQSRQRPDSPAGSPRFSLFRRVFTIQLSLVSLLGICLVTLIGVGWVFAFGVIIGRGFEPDDKMPVLGRLVAPPAETAPGQDGIMKAEDLTFFSDLKTRPTLSTEQPTPSSRPQEARSADQQNPDKPNSQAPRAPASGAAASGQPDAAKAARYDFVLQVVAYKQSAQAEAFRVKLENAGLRTRLQVEKDKQGIPRVYRVQVLFKGTDAETGQVREILGRYGIKEYLVIARKSI